MKWTWLFFTLVFSFLSVQNSSRIKSFNIEAEDAVEFELGDKSSDKNTVDPQNYFPLFFLHSLTRLKPQFPNFFLPTHSISVPAELIYDDRFAHSDRSPPVLS